MSKKHFDTIEQQTDYQNKKKKRMRIALTIVIILTSALAVIYYIMDKAEKTIGFAKLVSDATAKELIEYGVILLVLVVIAGIIYMIFRDKSKKFDWVKWGMSLSVSAGILMLGMFVLMVVKDLW